MKCKRMSKWLFCSLFFLINLGFSQTMDIYPFDSVKKQAQFNHLLGDLRCLVCQNQDLATSTAGLAKDLRDEVYKFVQTGRSDADIMRFLTQRYGDFVLFKPPVKSTTWILWFGPLFFLIIGALVFCKTCLKSKHHD